MERAFAISLWLMTAGSLLIFSIYMIFSFGVYEGKRQMKKYF